MSGVVCMSRLEQKYGLFSPFALDSLIALSSLIDCLIA